MREGGDFIVQRQRLVKIPGGNGCNHSLGVQLQRTRRIAVGGLLVDAQVLNGFQFLLGKHPLLTVYMGGGPFFDNHGFSLPFQRMNDSFVGRGHDPADAPI